MNPHRAAPLAHPVSHPRGVRLPGCLAAVSVAVALEFMGGVAFAAPQFAAGFISCDALSEYPYSVAAGDLNEDGLPDLAVNDTQGIVLVMWGTGDGLFSTQDGFLTNVPTYDIAVADLDRDGHLDIIAAGTGVISVLLGNGSGGFAERVNYGSLSVRAPRGIVVADLNGDGHLDVATGNGMNGVLVRLGIGDGTLGEASHYPAGFEPETIASGKLNGDDVPDLALSDGATVAVLLGNGLGGFGAPSLYPAAGVWGVATGDVTGDGNADLVTAGSFFPGNGAGGFGAQVVFLSPAPRFPKLADLNGDGRLDILALGDRTVTTQLGHANGSFDAPRSFVTGFTPQTILAADVNQDARVDAIVATLWTATVAVHLGNGDGTLGTIHNLIAGYEPVAVAIADVTRDGRADILTADYQDDTISLLPGLGNGAFGARIPIAAAGGVYTVAVGDVNGDGSLDVVSTSDYTHAVSVYPGDGVGGLLPRQDFAAGGPPIDLVVADLNGDGRADVVTRDPLAPQLSVFLAQGTPLLGAPTHYPTGGAGGWDPGGLAVSDLDVDGRPDVVVMESSGGGRLLVFRGLGNGTFAAATVHTVGIDDLVDLAVGDIGGDGRPDVVVLGAGLLLALRGNGNGTWGALSYLSFSNRASSVMLADVDRDGRLDLVTTQSFADAVSIRLGNGAGGFGDPAGYGVGRNPVAAAVGDLDFDGGPDLVVANQYFNDISVLPNLLPSLVGVPVSPASGPREAFALGRIGPNPTSGRVRIEYLVPRETQVRVAVADLQGREVAQLAGGFRPAGRYEVSWTGSGRRGPAPPGIYFVVYRAAGRTATRRIILVR